MDCSGILGRIYCLGGLNGVAVNDYFIFKFIVNLSDGRRIAAYFANVSDESRNEFGDPRTGVRFKSQ